MSLRGCHRCNSTRSQRKKCERSGRHKKCLVWRCSNGTEYMGHPFHVIETLQKRIELRCCCRARIYGLFFFSSSPTCGYQPQNVMNLRRADRPKLPKHIRFPVKMEMKLAICALASPPHKYELSRHGIVSLGCFFFIFHSLFDNIRHINYGSRVLLLAAAFCASPLPESEAKFKWKSSFRGGLQLCRNSFSI